MRTQPVWTVNRWTPTTAATSHPAQTRPQPWHTASPRRRHESVCTRRRLQWRCVWVASATLNTWVASPTSWSTCCSWARTSTWRAAATRGGHGVCRAGSRWRVSGNHRYPSENEYDSYISDHGGYTNAFTECEYTCYHFDVNADHLQPAMDRLARFFVGPLLRAEAAEREVRSVNSEFDQARTNDTARLDEVRRELSRKGHPNHKFGWGNVKSLEEDPAAAGIDVRAKSVHRCCRVSLISGIVAVCACAYVAVLCCVAGAEGVVGVPPAVLLCQHHGCGRTWQ